MNPRARTTSGIAKPSSNWLKSLSGLVKRMSAIGAEGKVRADNVRVESEGVTEAEDDPDRGRSALIQLRAYLAQKEHAPSTRLPPERVLSEILGVTRNELRKALAVLEAQGELWRHVGKGTFVGARPVAELSSLAAIAAQ